MKCWRNSDRSCIPTLSSGPQLSSRQYRRRIPRFQQPITSGSTTQSRTPYTTWTISSRNPNGRESQFQTQTRPGWIGSINSAVIQEKSFESHCEEKTSELFGIDLSSILNPLNITDPLLSQDTNSYSELDYSSIPSTNHTYVNFPQPPSIPTTRPPLRRKLFQDDLCQEAPIHTITQSSTFATTIPTTIHHPQKDSNWASCETHLLSISAKLDQLNERISSSLTISSLTTDQLFNI